MRHSTFATTLLKTVFGVAAISVVILLWTARYAVGQEPITTAGPNVTTTETYQTFDRQVGIALSGLTYTGSNVVWDVSTKQCAYLNVTNNIYVSNVVNAVPGFFYRIKLSQTAAGNKTVNWNTNIFRWPNDIVPVLTTNSLRADVYDFWCDEKTNLLSYGVQNY